jgi:osmotically-inducible protein OsmY
MKSKTKSLLLAFTSAAAMSLTALAADEPKADADNTKKNERDRSGETQTPMDQSNSDGDIKITGDIRRAIMKDDSLSLTAKNVKIITANGQVMLRGPVNSAEEKIKIDNLAKSAAGEAKVMNHLEVKAADKP